MPLQSSSSLEQQKELLASDYIVVFKKELSDTEQHIISNIEDKMKQALLSDTTSFEKILQEFGKFLSPSMIDRIKIFLVEKREVLSQVKTEEALQQLKAEINAYEANPMNTLKAVGLGLTADIVRNKIKNAPIEVKKINTSVDEVVTKLKKSLANPELTKRQQKEIKSMITTFSDAPDYVKSAEALEKRKGLVDKKLFPVDLLKNTRITKAGMEALELIKTKGLSVELAGKSADEIKRILSSNNISGLGDDVVDILAKGTEVGHIDDMIHVLSATKNLSQLAKIAGKIPFVDIAVQGWQTYEYARSEKNARTHAHFGVSTSMNIVGAMGPILCTGPVGRAVVGGAIVADIAISHAMDVGYFDLQDLYHQDSELLKSQDDTLLKQTLIQAIAGGTRKDVSLNEDTYNVVCSIFGQDDGKTKTAEDVMKALVYKQETRIGGDQKEVESCVTIRMEYLKDYLPGGDKVGDLSRRIHQSQGMGTIDNLLQESKIYKEMKQDAHTKASTIEAYQQQQFDTLQVEYPDIVKKLDALIEKDQNEASEFFQQVEAYTIAAQQDLTKDSEFLSVKPETQIQDNDVSYFTQEVIDDSGMIDGEEREKLLGMADVILRYKKLKDFSGKLPIVAVLNYTFMSTEQTLQDIISGKDIVTHSQNSNEVDTKTMIIDRTDIGIESEYSHDIRQNIIYRIAKEFHSYGGANNMQELIMYFTPKHDGEENEKGLYYDPEKKQWMINDDYDIDIPLDFSNIENKSIDQIIADRFQKVPSWQKIAMAGTIPGIGGIASSLLPKQHIDAIDTKTETTDNQLNREFFAKVRKIVEEEKEAIDPKYKKVIDKKIHDYLDVNIVDGYIKLPGYLIQEAQRVGLGNLTYRFFTKKEGKIVGLTSNEYMSSPMNVSGVTKTYINDIDGKEQGATIESIAKEQIKTVTKPQTEIIKKKNEIVKKIENTARSLMRANRGQVIYDPMTERLSSRGTGTKISQKNGKYILDDGKLSIVYTSLEEAIAVAVVKNWFTGEYAKKNPDMDLKYQRYLGIGPKGLRDVNNRGSRRYANDTRLLTDDFIKKNLPVSFIDGAQQKKIIEYFIS